MSGLDNPKVLYSLRIRHRYTCNPIPIIVPLSSLMLGCYGMTILIPLMKVLTVRKKTRLQEVIVQTLKMVLLNLIHFFVVSLQL